MNLLERLAKRSRHQRITTNRGKPVSTYVDILSVEEKKALMKRAVVQANNDQKSIVEEAKKLSHRNATC